MSEMDYLGFGLAIQLSSGFVIQDSVLVLQFFNNILATLAASSGKLLIQNMLN